MIYMSFDKGMTSEDTSVNKQELYWFSLTMSIDELNYEASAVAPFPFKRTITANPISKEAIFSESLASFQYRGLLVHAERICNVSPDGEPYITSAGQMARERTKQRVLKPCQRASADQLPVMMLQPLCSST